MSAQQQPLYSRSVARKQATVTPVTTVDDWSKSRSSSVSSKRYPYRYLAPLVTFLASILFAANGELQLGWILGTSWVTLPMLSSYSIFY